jgi:hypothetical protein
MPVSTFRAWVLGLFFAIVVPGLNQFFYFRYPAVNISQVCLRLFFLSLLCFSLLNQVPCAKVHPYFSVFAYGQAVGLLRPEGFPVWYPA